MRPPILERAERLGPDPENAAVERLSPPGALSDTASDPSRQRNEPFFVIGASRSGTTMFRLMLNAHSRILIPGETWFLSDLMDTLPRRDPLTTEQVDTAHRLITSHWRWKEWGIADERLRRAYGELAAPRLADLVRTLYALALEGTSKARWGDKTPGYVTEVHRLHELLPEARFLHLIRDGRDVCLSLKKTGWRGESTWEIARYWGAEVGRGLAEGRALPAGRYMEISYEALVLETERVLHDVCDFLGETFEEGMLSFYETATENIPDRAEGHLKKTRRPPRPTDVQRWKRELEPRKTMVFEAFAGSTLEDAGYERRYRKGLAAVRGFCHGFEGLATVTRPIRKRLGIELPGLRKRF